MIDFKKKDIMDTFDFKGKTYQYVNLNKLQELTGVNLERLPKTIKILLENAIRNYDGNLITSEHINQLLYWGETEEVKEVGFIPSRIVLQDFTGVPAVVDLAAMRNAVARMGKDPSVINPLVPVDLVIDHSVMVDAYGTGDSLRFNVEKEFERNHERYRFLKWAQNSFENFRAVPPSTGIIHQVNLEYLATVVAERETEDGTMLIPDTLVGTDSHTTMINGIGVLGWGVGGIEAEAGMLGQPLYFVTPEVVGVHMKGQLQEGVTATDLALRVTELLRQNNVVGKFVEYFGPGVQSLTLPDRATVSNMSPEYGATMGYFAADEETLEYMAMTGREEEKIDLVREYLSRQNLFGIDIETKVEYSQVIELDLTTLTASLAGPKRPQDRVALDDLKKEFREVATKAVEDGGYGIDKTDLDKTVLLDGWKDQDGQPSELRTGDVVIAAITSCTNTSNPSVMIGAGIIAKKAVEAGLTVPNYVKTSLTPGSLVVTDYLKKADVLESLEKLGFNVAGYGCATCIGNSGPLDAPVRNAIIDNDMLVGSVLSGNRNFEGRIHQHVKANYLASPMLVVAYALAGTLDIDFKTESIGKDKEGKEVFLKDLWPSNSELKEAVKEAVSHEMFIEEYKGIYEANNQWNMIEAPTGMLYEWEEDSTYIREPDFFKNLEKKEVIEDITNAKVLLSLGDSITTDHISPAGSISKNSPAGIYLASMGVDRLDFNSYGSRRGNHEVMMRGTFANIRIRNRLADGVEGGYTTMEEKGEVMSVFDAAMQYQSINIPLIVLAGKEYGTGSSRDWAAKGTNLLGIKAVIAESYERIHRSNLVGMGVLPLQFLPGESSEALGLTGRESYSIEGLAGAKPMDKVKVVAESADGKVKVFEVRIRLDSAVDIDYYLNQGILQKVLLEI